MQFCQTPVSFFIPHFAEMQRESFLNFLEKGLIKEIETRNPITNFSFSLVLKFYPQYYRFDIPELTTKQSILQGKTYSANLYVPVQLISIIKNKTELQWAHLGQLPLMTKRGHFIVNGAPRILLNQLVRMPGIYFQENIDVNNQKKFYADFISQRGSWLRLEIDKKDQIWARMKKTPKIPIVLFLQALGFSLNEINTHITHSFFLKNSYLKKNHPKTLIDALVNFYSIIHSSSLTKDEKSRSSSTPTEKSKSSSSFSKLLSSTDNLSRISAVNKLKIAELGSKFLYKKFRNPKRYDLGNVGRFRLNQKLQILELKNNGISLGKQNEYTLTPGDIFIATDYLIRLKFNDPETSSDDIDHLRNRRVRTSGELVQNQLCIGLLRLEKIIREKLETAKKEIKIENLVTTKPINGVLQEFFGSSTLSQYMDQTNPLAEMTHKRRLTSLGPGGISRETAGMDIRGIHPTHFGRICPIETPEGRNAGLVNSVTTYAQINSFGLINTPYYKVYRGQIQNFVNPFFLSPSQEENVKVAPGDLQISNLHFLSHGNLPIKFDKEFKKVVREQVNYIGISPIQIISVATSLIPFLEHDDANRALMGSNMQRQSVPLLLPERAIVGTGVETKFIADSGHCLQAKESGYVRYSTATQIHIQHLKKCLITKNNLYKNYFLFKNKNFFYTPKPIKTGLLSFLYESKRNRNEKTKQKFIFNNNQYNFSIRYKKIPWDSNITKFVANPFKIFKIKIFSGIIRSFEIPNKENKTFFLSTIELKYLLSKKQFEKIKIIKKFNFIEPLSIIYLQNKNFENNPLINKKLVASQKNFNTFSSISLFNNFLKPWNLSSLLPIQSLNFDYTFLIYPIFIRFFNKREYTQFFSSLMVTNKSENYLKNISISSLQKKNNNQKKFLVEWKEEKKNKQKIFVTKNQKFVKNIFITKENFGLNIKKKINKYPLFWKNYLFQKSIKILTINSSVESAFSYQTTEKLRNFNLNFKNIKKSNFVEEKTTEKIEKQKKKIFLQNQEEKNISKIRTYDLQLYQRSNQETCLTQKPLVKEGEWVQKGDLISDSQSSLGGELSLGKNISIAYMGWEGYNFEDAILINERLVYDDIFTSIHIKRYEIEVRETQFGMEQITNQIPDIDKSILELLDKKGIVKIGTWVEEGMILVGKITPTKKKNISGHEKLLYDLAKKTISTTLNTSIRVPKYVEGRIIDVQILEPENTSLNSALSSNFEGPQRVHIYIAEKKKIQVGDKMSGRHGNKGIISKILPKEDMPYLPNGVPVDMILNPLGIPSRMNVGQVFECLLGLAGFYLKEQYKISLFDEFFGPEASRSLVYSKLYSARLKTGQNWLFDPEFPGKTPMFDGRTGELFDQSITVGQAYILKLVHLVDEKIHARSIGPYSLVTQQPVRGRAKHGGQRFGEMEVWALEGFGAAYILQELLTLKSDDVTGRKKVSKAILTSKPIVLGTPEAFKVLVRELQSLCLDVRIFIETPNLKRKPVNLMKLK